MSEDVDFEFFDSPKTKTADEDGRNVPRSSAMDRASSRSTSTVTDDAASERTLTSSKPPTHPKSRRVRRSGGDDDGDNDADQADSPRSNASASTNQSRRTINAKIPSVANDDDDDRSDNNSDDDSSRTRSAERSSHRSGKDDHSRRSSSVASSGDRRKKDGKDASSNRSSNLSQEERNSDSQSSKRRNKKSLYLSDDSETDQSSDVSDTDSDVTRVSPLNSPHETMKSKKNVNRAKSAGKSRAARGAPNGPDNSGTLNFNQILNAHKDTLDLKVLLQTVLEMENDHSSVKNRDTRSRFGAAPAGDFCRQRRNYSFNNDQVTKIDKENQRLMEIILRNAREAKKKKKEIKMAGTNPWTATRLRPTSSAINRVRQQQKIEAENLVTIDLLFQSLYYNIYYFIENFMCDDFLLFVIFQ